MNVAVDAFNLPHDRRGMGRFVRGVLHGLSDRGNALTLICRNDADAVRVQAEFPLCEALARAQIRKRKFDAAWFPWNGLRYDLGAPAVLTLHDIFAFEEPHPNFVARWREQQPIRRGVKHAAALSTISHWSAGRIAAYFHIDAPGITVIPPLLEKKWTPGTRSLSDPFVLFVAGPEKRKNATLLFRAFARAFKSDGPQLVVAGTLGALDEAVLKQSTIRHRRVRPSDEELRALYSDALAVAVPSTREGYGLVALEAMACGAPVIAAQAAALPEACDDAAVLLSPNDEDAWADALRQVVNDEPLRANLGGRSLVRAARIDRDAPARVMAELLQKAALR